MTGKCFLVATPIGNLRDITLRALDTLNAADIIACEDTRHTLKLLNFYGIKKPLISYHMHNERQCAEKIVSLIKDGNKVAVVSDAGMPCISDPGAVLVRAMRDEGIEPSVIPGASALTAAAALSGIEKEFVFLGFLKEKTSDKRRQLEPYIGAPAALIIYCAPHDLGKTLSFLFETLGGRRAHIIKEITKLHEGVFSGVLGQLEIENPRGEFVIIIEPAAERAAADINIAAALERLISGGASKKDAVDAVCKMYGLAKNTVYSYTIKP